jgi:UDP-glucose 4-epimerase
MNFVLVEDVARANITGLSLRSPMKSFNIGMGVKTTLNELCHLLLKGTGSSLKPGYYPARKVNNIQSRRAAIEKAQTMLGFRAHVDLENSLRALIQWREETKAEMTAMVGSAK